MATVVKVVATGRAIISNRIKGAGTEPKHTAWGTGAVAPVDGNTALGTESAEARVEAVTSVQTTLTANDTYRAVATMTAAGAGRTVSEAGLFDDGVAGNLFLRGTFDGIALEIGDSIQFTMEAQGLEPA